MKSQAIIIKQTELDETERKNIFQLHRQYYDNVFEDVFMNDLSGKDWIIIMRDEQGWIQGFSTIQLIRLKIEETDHLYLFSGDTIMSEEIRNTPNLAGAFIHFMYALIENYPETPIHWFLITKGYRTYRFLPLYFKEYYPVHDKAVPGYYKKVLDAVAFHKFGDQYSPETHLIRYKTEKDYLKPEFSTIAEGRLKNPAIRFFCTQNPFFYKGDELTCITNINVNNFNSLVDRVWRSTNVQFTWKR